MARNPTAETVAGRAATFRADVATRAETIPAWLAVGSLVLVSAVARYLIARSKPAPWIFPDSLVYSELAKSFAATGHFALREVPGRQGFGIVYPLLLAPTYAAFKSVPAAFSAMKAINCIAMSLVAIPTYLLARSFVGMWLSLLAAALALSIPDVAYSGTIMTENAFYPAFAFASWGIVRALQRPTIGRQLLALGLIVLVFLTRPQGVVIAPALATALALIALLEAWETSASSLRARLLPPIRRYGVLWGGLAVGAIGYFGAAAARGRSWRDVLGAYAFLGNYHYSASAVAHWFLYHVGELDFALVLLPFAALLLVFFVALRPNPIAPELRPFAAYSLAVSFWILLGVAIFASTPFASRILERSTFYLAPLFVVALVTCVGRGFAWTNRTAAAVAAVVAVGLAGVVPYASYLGPNEANDSFTLMTLNSVLDRGWVALPQLQAAVVLGATLAGALFLLVPRRFGLALPMLALVMFALANGPVERRIRGASEASIRGGIQAANADWIDRAVGTTKPVVAELWTGRAAYVTLWDNEFFNRSVGKVYNFYGPPDGLPQETASVDPASGVVRVAQRPLRPEYVLTDSSLKVVGATLATDKGAGMAVYRTSAPLRVLEQTTGLYPDRWSGDKVTYERYGCAPGSHLTVTLLSDRDLHPSPQTIVASDGSQVLARFVYRPGTVPRKMSLPLISRRHVCDVAFTIPTAVPLQVTHLPDTRALGVRFLKFEYRGPR